jgi:nucleotide-binding universal stress UspA family protein
MTILVAVDLSTVSDRMLEAVRRMPRCEGMKVVIVHVAEPDPEFVGWEAGPGVVRDQMAREFRRERQEVERMAATVRADGMEAVGLVIQGPTVATVLAEIERVGAELVVVGSHGHGAAYDLVIGSVSSGIIRKAPVPVLVVPDRSQSGMKATEGS